MSMKYLYMPILVAWRLLGEPASANLSLQPKYTLVSCIDEQIRLMGLKTFTMNIKCILASLG